MFKELLALLGIILSPASEKRINPPKISSLEIEAISKIGIIGLTGVWELYDMWI